MNLLSITLLAMVILALSCKKPAGEGGRSKITGRVWMENYNTLNHPNDVYNLIREYPGEDEDVYIIYGNEIGFGDKVKAGPGGIFVFDNLRAGDYRICVESKDTNRTSLSGVMSVETSVSLSKKGTKDVGTFLIFK